MVKRFTLSVVICTYTMITFQHVQSKENLRQECVETPFERSILSGGYRQRKKMIIDSNTATSCLARCKTLHHGISGVQNKHCYCGDHVNIGNKGRCNTRCPGDKAEFCDGLNSTSVVFTSASQPHGYIGCYPDSPMVPVYGQEYTRNSGKHCIRLCVDWGHRYAGTQIEDCKCSNSTTMGDNTEAACTVRCPGNFKFQGGAPLCSVNLINTTNKTTATTSLSSKPSTTETQRPKWSKTSQKMSSASYRTEAGSTEVFTTESITHVNDKTKASITAISSVTDTDVDTTTSMAALYISIPVVLTAAAVTFLVICFILRRRRKQLKSEPLVKYNGNQSRNRCQNSGNGTDLESNDLSEQSNADYDMSNTSQCIERTAESRESEENMSDTYSTIAIDRGNTLESQSYDNFKTKPICSKSTRAVYSHIQIAQRIPTIYPADNAYSHIGACTLPEQPKRIADETDNTYNVLKSAQCTSMARKRSNGHDDDEAVYDKAIIGRKHHAIHVINDEYALLKRV